MSHHHDSHFEPGIVPLTFLQTLAARHDLMQALREQPHRAPYWPLPPKNDRLTLRQLQLLKRLNLVHSGYGMLDDEDMLGYLWLRGWHQVLYLAALVVKPEFRRQGIGRQFVAFAEKQAIELRRKWVGVTVARNNATSVHLFEEASYKLAHSQVWTITDKNLRFSDEVYQLRPVRGAVAWQACRDYAAHDLEAVNGEGLTEPVAFIVDTPALHIGRQWVLQVDGEDVAYLNLHRNQDQPTLYIASKPEWRGKSPLLSAIQQITQKLDSFSLQFASVHHHIEVQTVLKEHGFQESKLPIIKLYKYLHQQ